MARGLIRLAEVATVLILLFISVPALPAVSQPSTGNWTVTGTEVVENKTVFLSGNLTIEQGASLTLRNVTLVLSPRHNGSLGMLSENGSALFIYNSTVVSSDPKLKYFFVVQGRFVMKGSTLTDVGWCLPQGESATWCFLNNRQAESGPVVATDNATIERNIFSGNAIGLVLFGSNETVKWNTFSYNTFFSLLLSGSSNDIIANNTVLQNSSPISGSMVQLWSASDNNTFSRNTLTENVSYYAHYASRGFGRFDGFNLGSSEGNIFVNNIITSRNIPIFLIHSDNSVVVNNTLNYGENAINIITGVNTKIEGNRILSIPPSTEYPNAWAPADAIVVTLAHNSIIANNTIAGRAQAGMHLTHTSNSSILNNGIFLTRPALTNTLGTYQLGAMVLVGSRNNSVAGNVLSGSPFGMVLTGASDGNLITRNTILTDHSISIMGSFSNRIFLNNLHDFKEPFGGPYDNGVNIWHDGFDGNYWSHYTGKNSDGNGVGEEPYSRSSIPPDGVEPYSLSNPVEITPSPIPQMKQIPLPRQGSRALPWTLIEDQTMEIEWGDFPENLTIVNSRLTLGRLGIVRMGCSVTIINSTLVSKGYGFAPWGGSRPCASSLTIRDSTLDGAFLDDMQVDSITIVNSTILNSMLVWGVGVEQSRSVVIENNTISGVLGGIATYSSVGASTVLISGNKIYDVIDHGVMASGSPDRSTVIENNTVAGAMMGTGIEAGGFAVARGNTVSGMAIGFQLWGAQVVFYQNDFVNTLYPMIDWGAGVIYHNNFIGYLYPPVDKSDYNELSMKGGGNYWSNYTGRDLNLDGIGDTPYMISGGGARDSYPFMNPNGWLTQFWLNISTNYPGIPFKINGTSLTTNARGDCSVRLGYVGTYSLDFPQRVSLPGGVEVVFQQWGDAHASLQRTISLSSSSTLRVLYQPDYVLYLAAVAVIAVITVSLAFVLRKRRQAPRYRQDPAHLSRSIEAVF